MNSLRYFWWRTVHWRDKVSRSFLRPEHCWHKNILNKSLSLQCIKGSISHLYITCISVALLGSLNLFNKRKPSSKLSLPQAWNECAKALYNVSKVQYQLMRNLFRDMQPSTKLTAFQAWCDCWYAAVREWSQSHGHKCKCITPINIIRLPHLDVIKLENNWEWKQLGSRTGDDHCWFAEMQAWLRLHGITIMHYLHYNIAWFVHTWTWLNWKKLEHRII